MSLQKHYKYANDLLRLGQFDSINPSTGNLISKLKGKPFYCWDQDKRGFDTCCFNHIVGLSQKNNKEFPLFDYEQLLFDKLFLANYSQVNHNAQDKHLFVLKATGLGITEFFLRIIGWLCTKDDNLKGSQVCIVTGPRVELSITLIDRLKALFLNLGVIFANKETVLELNGVKVEVYPSHHLDAMRGLANVSFILLDEADFFPIGQQQDARDISERYIGKSNPFIVMASTPNAPNSLFWRIEQETEQECIYNRVKLD